MPLTYFEISYPNFTLGSIIDPEEANQNNYEIVTKINSLVTFVNTNEANIANLTTIKADNTYVDNKFNELAGVDRTTQTVKSNADNLISHKTSGDHDTRYYTKTQLDGGQLDNRYYTETEINSKLSTVNYSILANSSALNTHKTSTDHDSRYYTKQELSSWAKGGDTIIKREVFTIVNNDNLDGTFTYIDGDGVEHLGVIGVDGEQIFTLHKGFYEPGTERLEIIINDTLHRTATSGGLVEISSTEIAITTPEQNGAEITVKYYERLGVGGIANLEYGSTMPTKQSMWFKVVG